MRKLLLIFTLMLFTVTVKAQVYDGITQPTKYRIWLPITTSLDGGNSVSVSPFVGYKHQAADWLSITPVIQYSLNNESLSPQVWLNFNIKQKYYLLSRSIYDCKTSLYKHTLSATVKLPLDFMIDATWSDMYNGHSLIDGDRLQFVVGIDCGVFIINAGYSVRATQGFIANIRFKITQYNWLQLRYDGGTRLLGINAALQFN